VIEQIGSSNDRTSPSNPSTATEITALSGKDLQKLADEGNEEAIAELDRRAHNKHVKQLLAKHGIREAA
jgi:hypothetical protein